MSQKTNGLYMILSSPFFYDFFQAVLSKKKNQKLVVEKYATIDAGMNVLDIGCGTARLLGFMPSVNYSGYDISLEYINAAKRKYGSKGEFHCMEFPGTSSVQSEKYDRVLMIGLLHHLDDKQVNELLKIINLTLKSGGKLITIDGVFTPSQSMMARWFINRDRGQNVRTIDGYRNLAISIFDVVVANETNLARIPYTHCIMECVKK